ncbi:MAG: polysaccharide biosynthesis tyrosine autokinase, partial [Acidobacteria bacterium]|nr:polysaccharide biosynthesis tyrosine autokinase [Acidobacteriota bacterium]
ASEWLDARTRELKAKLEQAEQKLADFSSRNDVSLMTSLGSMGTEDGSTETSKGGVLSSKLGSLQAQATKAETERILKESLYEEVKQGRVDKLPEAFGDARITALQTRLGELSITAAQNVGRYGPDNPRTIQSQKEVAALKTEIEASRGTLAEKLKADYERAQRDEAALKAALAKALVAARAESIQQNYAAVQFSLIRQEVETAKSLYADFLQKNTQADMQLAEQTNNLHVIDPAQVPRSPVGPNRYRSIIIAMLLSLCAGFGLALAIEFFDDTLKVTDDITRYVGLPTLALIPAVQVSRVKLTDYQAQGKVTSALGAGAPDPATAALQQVSSEPIVRTKQLNEKNRNVLIEAYRSLRASIMLSTASQPPKTILFTSSQPGEGKTTTATNTAISLGQLGLSVLVIDADMRRPAVHRVFGLKRSFGLSSYLSSDVAHETLIQRTHMPNVSVMASGAIPPNPTELVSSEKMRELLQRLSTQFDHILIDAPPLLNVTDPVVLSTLTDGVILVVQSGRSKRHFVRRAHRELAQVGAKVFGVVLNNVDVNGAGYSDIEYARYRYEYGSEKKNGTNG